jgi:hypothetical protein
MSSNGSGWRSTLGVVALTAAVLFHAAPAASPASKKKPIEFREGIKALELGDWRKVADLMSKANDKQEEDGEKARIDGNDYRAYLPLYYLGLALYKTNNCTGAKDQWKRSLDLGFVKLKPEFEQLQEYMAKCP